MKVKSFRSKKKDIEVYHNNDKCSLGDNIQPENKVLGAGGLKLCELCKKKNAKGK